VTGVVDSFEDWLRESLSYLRIRSIYRQCPHSVQRFLRDMEEAALNPAATPAEREQAGAALAAVLMTYSPGHTGPVRPKASAGNGHLTAFADRLRARRTEKGLTQEELARRVGIRQSAVSMMESGRCRPQPSTLAKLAKELGVDAKELWPKHPAPSQ
jgi:ribosome-binding protein aMBF1 (putative translation factor)